jgi:hypothetical protein
MVLAQGYDQMSPTDREPVTPMSRLLARARARLTYANVTATLALFIALGGTTYAATSLPRNSVGTAQLRRGAVHGSDIRDRTIRVQDIAVSARGSLRGSQGPAGPAGPAGTADRAAVNSGGGVVAGTARDNVNHAGGSNEYTVQFPHDVSRCVYSATLAAVQNGPTLEQPPAGRITVASAGGANVLVKTYDANGVPTPAPFHLLVSC